jgi:rubrerythrin
MDLKKYTKEEVFLSAMKSEIEAKRIYTMLADRIMNAYMKDRLLFLADEEAKHYKGLEKLYKNELKKKSVKLPEATPVPLPALKEPGPSTPVSEVIASAMAAEKGAQEFYLAFAALFPPDSDQSWLLIYFSNMEKGHYQLLESEKALMEKEEYFDTDWPMMHVGP